MKLSLKQKALLITTGLFAGAIFFVHLIRFIALNVSIEVLTNAFGAGIIGFFLYMMYQLVLHRLEYNKMVEDSTKKD